MTKLIRYWFKGPLPMDASKVPDNFQELFQLWYNGGTKVDEELKLMFESDVKNHHLLPETDLESKISKIILLDQIPRNIYRNTSNAFAYDSIALSKALEIIDNQQDKDYTSPIVKHFLYLPLEHSEDLNIQKKSVLKAQEMMDNASPEFKQFTQTCYKYAKEHYEIIDRFGRFPHRNHLLNRTSTNEEVEYLKSLGGNLFGVKI